MRKIPNRKKSRSYKHNYQIRTLEKSVHSSQKDNSAAAADSTKWNRGDIIALLSIIEPIFLHSITLMSQKIIAIVLIIMNLFIITTCICLFRKNIVNFIRSKFLEANLSSSLFFKMILIVSFLLISIITTAITVIDFSNNLNGDAVNGGYASEANGWIYYANQSDGHNLYKMKLNGNEKTKINDVYSSCIAVDGKWIYYFHQNPISEIGLYKMKTDGTSLTPLVASIGAEDITVLDEWVYFRNNGDDSVHRVKTDGTQHSKIIDGRINYVNVTKHGIFFQKEDEDRVLYSSMLDGTNVKSISQDLVWNPIVYDKYIYYTLSWGIGDGLYRINLDGSNKTKICDISSAYFNISNGWIYYSNKKDNYRIYRIRINGTRNEKLTFSTGYNLCIARDWIFFRTDANSTIYKVKKDGTQESIVY